MLTSLLVCAGASVAEVPYIGSSRANPYLGPTSRRIELEYAVTIPAELSKKGKLDVFIPLAIPNEQQSILSRQIETDIVGTIGTEKKYGNEYWHAQVDQLISVNRKITVRYQVERKLRQTDFHKISDTRIPTADTQSEILGFLNPDSRVPTSGRIIDAMLKDIPATLNDTPIKRVRAVYDFVIENMEYKKVGSGWGQGDTYWACSMKYGNCTDFHALFISLARALKVPTRFEIGFPIPLDYPNGKVEGYHCWASVYLPQLGWMPVDASEAKKNPIMKELFFGNQPADRIGFTIGRDLVLDENQLAGPLNFFIYPHAEVNGEKVGPIPLEINYKEVGRITNTVQPRQVILNQES